MLAVGLFSTVLPTFADFYRDFDVELPVLTRTLMVITAIIGSPWTWLRSVPALYGVVWLVRRSWNIPEHRLVMFRALIGDTDWIYGLTMYERPTGEILAVMGYYRKYTTTLGLNTKHRHGLYVADARPGQSGNSGNGNNDQPWKSAQNRDKTYGPSFCRTADGQDRAMWGSDSGGIRRFNVSMAGGTHFGITLTADPRGDVNTGVGGYVSSPRPGPDGKSMVCSGGGGWSTLRIWTTRARNAVF